MTDLLWYAVPILVMYISFRVLKWNNRQQAAKRAPERMAAAAERGWSYEQEQTTFFEIGRWRGATNGIEWVAETARSGTERSRLDGAARGSATLVTRWYTQQRMPVAGPVLLLQGQDGTGETNEVVTALDEIDSPLARKLVGKVLDVGLSVKFGEPIGGGVDGASLQPLMLPAIGYDNYNLMVADASEASAMLFQRLGPALAAARAMAGDASLSVLITPEGLAISVPRWTYQADELVPIVDAGVALTNGILKLQS